MTSANINDLCGAVENGNWPEVLKMYQEKRELRMARVTAAGDTVLHLALSSGKERVAECMVDIVYGERINEQDENSALLSSVDENGDDKKLILGVENDRNNTPLHLAASMGNVKICKKISDVDPSLIARRNIAGETPLFLSALNGRKEAFLWLHYKYEESRGGSSTSFAPWIRDNSDTILHCAIAQEHFDVVIEIVHLYKDILREMMMMCNNELSPFHLLAATPSAFKSTDLHTRSFVVRLLYHCFFRVKKKQQATTMEELEKGERGPWIWAHAYPFYNYIINHALPEGSCWAALGNLIVILLCCLAFLPLVPLIVAEYWLQGIRKMKEKHTWSLQTLEELFQSTYREAITTVNPYEVDSEAGSRIVEMPLMIAAKNGVIEMVDKILDYFPLTLKDLNEEGKNTVLIAAEKRQTTVYKFLCEKENVDKSAFGQVDKDGNTALHLAAKLGVDLNMQTTTMVEEFKWFEFVKKSVPSEYWELPNYDGKTAEEIFRDNYKEHMKSDREWLNQTSQAGSVVSTLVSSMAFSNVTGNFDENNYSSLVALSFSLTSTISFLGILAFRSQSLNFWRYVPIMLHVAIFAMFGSIVSLWISLLLHGHSLTTYIILGSPIFILAIVSLPIFIGPMLMSMLNKVPAPSRNTTSAIRYQRPQKEESIRPRAHSGITRRNTF